MDARKTMNENRIKLIEVAEAAVQRTGLKALSFRTLAEEVGIKSSSVHYYFPEKSDLARVLIERYRDKLLTSLREITIRNESLRSQFSSFVDIFDEVARSNRICLCGMMAAEFTMLSEENQALLLDVFASIELWLINLFDTKRSDLATELTSAQLAKLILSGLEGALLLDRVMNNTHRMQVQKHAILLFMKQPPLGFESTP